VLRDVANDIGMHESTVSRVVTNKYMHTPQGVFELKVFLPQRDQQFLRRERVVGHHQAAHPEDHRGRGRAKPLSDSKIVSILQKEGLSWPAGRLRSTARN